MGSDLERFDLREMLRCGLEIRRVTTDAATLEAAAQRVCRFFYDELEGTDGARACALVRCYKTHPFGALEPELQAFARRRLGAQRPHGTMKCLTLLATVGDEPAWNSRRSSNGHQVIPLPSPEIVEKAPMIAQLIRELGLELSAVARPSHDVMLDLAGKTYGVFHVQEARGSPYIPAQDDFVVPYGIRSVLGFGGSLVAGDLFAIILFSRVPVPSTTAERFRALALDVKGRFFHYKETQIFDPAEAPTAR